MNMVKDGRIVGTVEQYTKRMHRNSNDTLRYIVQDCKAAIEALPTNPNCAYYQQEIDACESVLKKRDAENEEQWQQAAANAVLDAIPNHTPNVAVYPERY